MSMNKTFKRILFCVLLLGGASAAAQTSLEQVERGEYLTRVGNCAGCHTAPGGDDFAGGRQVESGFGVFYAPNITPDPDTGIGSWTADQFWGALHQGRRADGAALYPACPYPNYTRVQRSDVDAIYAYLRSLPAVRQANREHDLRFPASMRVLVRLWQAAFFKPGVFEPDPGQSRQWNRGAYLVQGLGHCSACHEGRNAFGATRSSGEGAGGRVRGWYAPTLMSSTAAGLQAWEPEEAAILLRHGRAEGASMLGPMADVVFASLQYLREDDALAMAVYLQALPDQAIGAKVRRVRVPADRLAEVMELGRSVYERHCQDCHGDAGQGSVAASALAGNRAVILADPANLFRVIRNGGYLPATTGNPRPFGMPPFSQLTVSELAAVMTYIRTSWGNAATPVSTVDVERAR